MMNGSMILVLLVVSAGALLPAEAISCSVITPSVLQCAPFVLGVANQPSGACCNELRRLAAMAPTTNDKRQLCYCYKQLIPKYQGFQDPRIIALPKICGVSLSFSVSKDIDCSKIS